MTTNCPTGETIDLLFPVVGAAVPRNHGYGLYGAVSRLVPSAHEARDIGLFPINGAGGGEGTIRLNDRSIFRLRLQTTRLPTFLTLAGKPLEIDGHRFRLGVPRVEALVPAPTLVCELVLIKLARSPETTIDKTDKTARSETVAPDVFLIAAQKQLTAMEIAAQPHIQLTLTGPHAGKPRRRVIKVKSQTHAGYAMVVEGLTAGESIRLQERGLGGRHLMGCGLFLPGDREGRHVRQV
jgi:hypothetical protein